MCNLIEYNMLNNVIQIKKYVMNSDKSKSLIAYYL